MSVPDQESAVTVSAVHIIYVVMEKVLLKDDPIIIEDVVEIVDESDKDLSVLAHSTLRHHFRADDRPNVVSV